MPAPTSYKVSEAARITGIDRYAIYNAIKEGSLKAFRPWSKGDMRIHVAELDRWQRENLASPAARTG